MGFTFLVFLISIVATLASQNCFFMCFRLKTVAVTFSVKEVFKVHKNKHGIAIKRTQE